jgi:hypothetical protein
VGISEFRFRFRNLTNGLVGGLVFGRVVGLDLVRVVGAVTSFVRSTGAVDTLSLPPESAFVGKNIVSGLVALGRLTSIMANFCRNDWGEEWWLG